jgi:hypothetical protein
MWDQEVELQQRQLEEQVGVHPLTPPQMSPKRRRKKKVGHLIPAFKPLRANRCTPLKKRRNPTRIWDLGSSTRCSSSV